jgi:phosphoenolpyruvate synthase/pyruvate phosphate dikinase
MPETPCKDLTPKIYVTKYALPSWTPLFARTAALVTDSSGVLSHSAVVARGYGMPAVVGTGTATAVIRDGQVIEVEEPLEGFGWFHRITTCSFETPRILSSRDAS